MKTQTQGVNLTQSTIELVRAFKRIQQKSGRMIQHAADVIWKELQDRAALAQHANA